MVSFSLKTVIEIEAAYLVEMKSPNLDLPGPSLLGQVIGRLGFCMAKNVGSVLDHSWCCQHKDSGESSERKTSTQELPSSD